MSTLLRAWLLPLLWLASIALAAEGDVQPVPALSSPVTDTAGLLTPEQQQALVAKLQTFEQQKGSQIAVLIVPTTAPEDIFSYSFRIADHWKLGRKGVDDGVLFVVATQDKKTNLQIGYGLEGAIPDATSKDILQDIVRPHFQQGDFNGGINAGVDALIKAASGEPLPLPAANPQQQRRQGSAFVPALVVGVFAALFLQFLLGRVVGGLAGGVAGGVVATLLGISLLGAAGVGLLVAILIWLGVLQGRGFGGPFIGGGGFGGGGFGGGGGGWSGGGGGFGGGGASGNW